jgi:hypothetical protein
VAINMRKGVRQLTGINIEADRGSLNNSEKIMPVGVNDGIIVCLLAP